MSSMEKADLLKLVGKRIKEIRESKELAQLDVAVRMEGNIDTTNISRIESGRTNPTIYTLFRISQALEVPISDLLSIEYSNSMKNDEV
jgi:transcriptional regulator with XRE-family HTH domain